MAQKNIILTKEGLQKLEKELEYLKTVKRLEVASKIKEAMSYGDLSENSEYDEAKNEQAFVEGKIVKLENMLKKAKVIDQEDITTDVVSIGSIVKVLDIEMNEEIEYTIVGSAEADPINYKISDESPVGSALMNKRVGDIVEVNVPDGTIKYKILEIKK